MAGGVAIVRGEWLGCGHSEEGVAGGVAIVRREWLGVWP